MSKTASLKVNGWTITGSNTEQFGRIILKKLDELFSSGQRITSQLVRKATNTHGPVAIDTKKKCIGLWAIDGFNCISSDSAFQAVEEAVTNPVHLNQQYLQQSTGHGAPIVVDHDNLRVKFERF